MDGLFSFFSTILSPAPLLLIVYSAQVFTIWSPITLSGSGQNDSSHLRSMGTPHASPALTNSEHWAAPDVFLRSVQATFTVPLMNQAQSFVPL